MKEEIIKNIEVAINHFTFNSKEFFSKQEVCLILQGLINKLK